MEDGGVFVDIAFLACCAIVTWSASLYVFCAKKSEQRPLFVTIQMLFLNLFVICFALYFSTVWGKEGVLSQKKLGNLYATIGDTLFVIHDWLFTEQFLKTSLLLPVAFGNYDQDDELVV